MRSCYVAFLFLYFSLQHCLLLHSPKVHTVMIIILTKILSDVMILFEDVIDQP